MKSVLIVVVGVVVAFMFLVNGKTQEPAFIELDEIEIDIPDEPQLVPPPVPAPEQKPEPKPEPKKKWPDKPIIDNAKNSPSCPGGVCPVPRSPGYSPRWTIGESDIYAELKNRHGIDASHLSVDEAYRLHDSIHDKIGPVPAQRRGLFGRWR
jgi:hypothetical protein